MNNGIGSSPRPAGINPGRLFLGSCISLISTAVAFAAISAILVALKEQFVLSNEQLGWIGGAAIWGFTISIFIFGPLCDALGMHVLLRLAFLCHLLGVVVMIFATGFATLFTGALVISMGNGLVEAACNPLITTIYPNDKTKKLSQFHMWFPGGIVLGGLTAYGLDKFAHLGPHLWQANLAVILVPTIIYGIVFTGQKFPPTERLQSGVSFGGMVRGTFGRFLFWVLFICMMMTASLELGTNRWIAAILQTGGMKSAILILVWINGIMAVLRFFAGPIVHRLSPIRTLICSSILAGLGLLWLSFAQSMGVAMVASFVFALGVCYYWPTMLGVTSERIPKGGALALALMGGMGMAIVGLVTAPAMGKVIDKYALKQLDPARARTVLEQAATTFPALQAQANVKVAKDYDPGIKAAQTALAQLNQNHNQLTKNTVIALRAVNSAAPASAAGQAADALIEPADNYGGRIALRYVAPLSIILVVIFGLIFIIDKTKGGYRIEQIGQPARPAPAELAPR